MTESASGIVLAGGRSVRLGRDKRTLAFGSSGNQLEETVRRVATVTTEVIVAAGDEPTSVANLLRSAPPHAAIVPDLQAGAGPLGGLCAGLAAIHNDHAMVVACDLPFLSVSVLGYLLGRPRDYDLLVPRRANGRVEMLHAIYRRTCLPILRARLSQGQLRLHAAIGEIQKAGLTVRFVEDSDLARFDPGLRTFFNVNTAQDAREARRILNEEPVSEPGAESDWE